MTHIFPCRGCPLSEGCELREDFRVRAKAARATSIKFRCEKLRAEMRPGRRIVVTAPRVEIDPSASDYYGETTERVNGSVELRATITDVQGYKFLCTADPGQQDEDDSPEARVRFRKRQSHARILRFLDEPDAEVCPQHCVVRDDLCDRGQGFFTGERADQPQYRAEGLCHCGRKRWADREAA